MAIVLSEITKDSVQADGRRKIKYKYTFHTDETWDFDRGTVEASFDANADLAAHVQQVEEDMAATELERLISDAEMNNTDLTTTIPTHTLVEGESDFNCQKRLVRAVIKYFYNRRKMLDLHLVRKVALPVWLWVRQAKIDNGWTNTQVANYMGWTISTLARVDNWFTQLETAVTFLDYWFDDNDPEVE